LRGANIRSTEDLQKVSREDLAALRGLGEKMIARLEALLGRRFPSRTEYWLSRGLPVSVANVLVREGVHTLEDLGRLTREQLLAFRGIGYFSFRHCERLLGSRLPSERGNHDT
jgi:DNA-directed RNA polymerase alpha subunit